MSGVDAVGACVVVGCWVVFFYKLSHLRRSHAQNLAALRATVAVFGLNAVGFSLVHPLTIRLLDPLLALPGITMFAHKAVTMCTCLAVIALVLHLSRPEDAVVQLRIHARILAGMLGIAVLLYLLDHPEPPPGRPLVGAATFPYLVCLAYTAAHLVRLCMQYAVKVTDPLARLGLRLISGCCIITEIYVVIDLVYLLEWTYGLAIPGSPELSKVFESAAVVLLAVGLTLPAWGPKLGVDSLWWRVARWHATRRLQRLWNVVTGACPSVVLDRALLAASPHGKRLAVERLPVEIHDAWLQLRSHLRADDVALIDRLAAEHRLPAHQTAPKVAAARLAVSVKRRTQCPDEPRPASPPVEHLGTGSTDTLVEEVRFLCAVSKQLNSRFVRAVLDETRGRRAALQS